MPSLQTRPVAQLNMSLHVAPTMPRGTQLLPWQ
jgi:hypothetical protein